MRTLDHDFNSITVGEAKSETSRASYPPPFSIRFTFEERARLDAERGRHSLAAHIRECLFGDEVCVRRKPGNTTIQDAEALGRVLGALGGSRLSSNRNRVLQRSLIRRSRAARSVRRTLSWNREL